MLGCDGVVKKAMPGSWPAWQFPHLKKPQFKITSEDSPDYNCIAWAARDTTKWWDPNEDYYWPVGVPREATVLAFVKVFQTLGYEPCLDATPENGFEKIAIYAATNGKATHVARQLSSGKWTSKLGDCEDIEHNNLECLNGNRIDVTGEPLCYGSPVFYMRRSG